MKPKYDSAAYAIGIFVGILRDDCGIKENEAVRAIRAAYKMSLKQTPRAPISPTSKGTHSA